MSFYNHRKSRLTLIGDGAVSLFLLLPCLDCDNAVWEHDPKHSASGLHN